MLHFVGQVVRTPKAAELPGNLQELFGGVLFQLLLLFFAQRPVPELMSGSSLRSQPDLHRNYLRSPEHFTLQTTVCSLNFLTRTSRNQEVLKKLSPIDRWSVGEIAVMCWGVDQE